MFENNQLKQDWVSLQQVNQKVLPLHHKDSLYEWSNWIFYIKLTWRLYVSKITNIRRTSIMMVGFYIWHYMHTMTLWWKNNQHMNLTLVFSTLINRYSTYTLTNPRWKSIFNRFTDWNCYLPPFNDLNLFLSPLIC